MKNSTLIARSEISSEALDLCVGEKKMVYCPFCDNAPPSRPKMSITRNEMGILYNCFRAQCSAKGFINSMVSDAQKLVKPKKDFNPKKFLKYTEVVTDAMLAELEERYGITKQEVEDNELVQIKDREGLLMPLYNVQDLQYGHTTKYFDSDYKAVHYLTTDTSKLHFIRPRKDITTVTIVEDVLSAIRVHRFNQGVALLGTNLTAEHVIDLKKAGAKTLLVALDPDATNKAIGMIKKYALFFNSMKLIVLSDDPKNLSHDELKKQLGV